MLSWEEMSGAEREMTRRITELVAELAEVNDVAKACAKREQRYFERAKDLTIALKRVKIESNRLFDDDYSPPCHVKRCRNILSIIDDALIASRPEQACEELEG